MSSCHYANPPAFSRLLPFISCPSLHTHQIQAENSAPTVSASAAWSNWLERTTQARLAGRLSARLASIHFCLSVNNMASSVCVVVLTTTTTAPPPAAPPRPLTVAHSQQQPVLQSLRLALRCICSFQFTPPEWRHQPERCSQRRVRNVPFG